MNTRKNLINKYLSMGFWGIVILAFMFSGCSAKYKYGSYRRNPEVQQAFESRQVPADYSYYHYSLGGEPIVIFGIEPKYEMRSVMWKSVSSDTEEFRVMIDWVWEDYEYYKYGADILDPEGQKVGIFYTSVNETLFKFGPNNRIVVIPNTPFLWGPDGEGGDTWSN